MFIRYGFGYLILNGIKAKVKWCEDLNLKSFKCTDENHTVLAAVAHSALRGGYLHKDPLLSPWHSTEKTSLLLESFKNS